MFISRKFIFITVVFSLSLIECLSFAQPGQVLQVTRAIEQIEHSHHMITFSNVNSRLDFRDEDVESSFSLRELNSYQSQQVRWVFHRFTLLGFNLSQANLLSDDQVAEIFLNLKHIRRTWVQNQEVYFTDRLYELYENLQSVPEKHDTHN
jgi:hypothetical protein